MSSLLFITRVELRWISEKYVSNGDEKKPPQFEAHFDKIKPTVRHISYARPRLQAGPSCSAALAAAQLVAVRPATQGSVERRPPTTEGMPGIARHSSVCRKSPAKAGLFRLQEVK